MGIQSKQINKTLAAAVRVSGFSANGGSNTVTTAITSALSTAGDGGLSVPVQVASTDIGVITSGTNNRIEIWDATSKDKFVASNGEEVYGRLTESSGVYTLTYYTLPNTGTETAYSFGSSTSIDFEFGYRFDFYRYPTDAAIATVARNINQDPSQSAGRPYAEKLTITAQNTLPNLSKTPVSSSTVELMVWGVSYDALGGGTAYFTVNTTTKALTWSATNAGFNIDTTDYVVARYFTFE